MWRIPIGTTNESVDEWQCALVHTQADALRPRLQRHFYNPDPGGGSGWFQDKHCLGPLGALKRP
jgi:hypothetical protein